MRYTENAVRYQYDISSYHNYWYGMWYGVLGMVYRSILLEMKANLGAAGN